MIICCFVVGSGLKYVFDIRVHVERVLHQSKGDNYVEMFGLFRKKPWIVNITRLNWKASISMQNSFEFSSKISRKENVFCLRMFEHVVEAIMLVLVFQQRCKEERVWNLETDEILCIFINFTFRCTFLFFFFIQPWRVLTSTYPKLESDLTSDTSPSYNRRPADRFEVPCKHLCSGWIQTSLKRSVVSHFVCTFSWFSVGNKTKSSCLIRFPSAGLINTGLPRFF